MPENIGIENLRSYVNTSSLEGVLNASRSATNTATSALQSARTAVNTAIPSIDSITSVDTSNLRGVIEASVGEIPQVVNTSTIEGILEASGPRLEAGQGAGQPSPAATPPQAAQAAGTNQGQVGTPSEQQQTSSPPVSNLRPWIPIRPLEDRYDFRRGRKVFNLSGDGPPGLGGGSGPRSAGGTVNITGTGTASQRTIPGGGRGVSTVTGTPIDRAGTSGVPADQLSAIGYGEGQIDPVFAERLGLTGEGYTAADAAAVEQLRSFNEELGGGGAAAELTDGERAYAEERGYISEPTDTPTTTPTTETTEPAENLPIPPSENTTGTTYDSRISAELGARADGWPRSQLRRVVIDNGDGTFSILSRE